MSSALFKRLGRPFNYSTGSPLKQLLKKLQSGKGNTSKI